MNKIDTFIYFFIIAVGVLLIITCVLNAMDLYNRFEDCSEKNGMLIKTYKGYRCIEAKEIQ